MASYCSGVEKVNTRKTSEMWLVGYATSCLPQTKLPSKREVLSHFFHYKIIHGNVKKACRLTAISVLEVWDKARIPTQRMDHVISNVEKLFSSWQKLKKNKANKKKRSAALTVKENQRAGELNSLFDIAHANAINMIKIDEDKQFLESQRKEGRPGRMAGIDLHLALREARAQDQTRRQNERQIREQTEIDTSMAKNIILASTSESDVSSRSNSSSPIKWLSQPGSSTSGLPPLKRGRKDILDSNLAGSLDAAKLSDRKAAAVLTHTLKKVKVDPTEYNVNRASIRRARMKYRENFAQSIKSAFKANETPLIVHWDGKMLEDITGHEIVDRLPIIVSGKNTDQLLAVPKLASGTGEAMASAVFDTLMQWDILSKVRGVSFDTTATNTGRLSGACILLEQKLNRELLWLACRHHVLEIVLEAAVTKALGPSTGPDILPFVRFKKHWPSINKDDFQTADELILETIGFSAVDRILAFANEQLEVFQPRDDYRELLDLVIIFLGGVLKKDQSFKAPAGLHRARWMAKAIYALKLHMFQGQFSLTSREATAVREICIFVVKIYVGHWFEAPSSRFAPRKDLQLLKELKAYSSVNAHISQLTLKKFSGHLWYLSEVMVALAFFDENVPVDTKKKMVKALQKEGEEHPVKRVALDHRLIEVSSLEDFVSNNTLNFFEITGLSSEFLNADVSSWEADPKFQEMKSTVSSMRVVNDLAERGVALMEEYNKLHTNDEEQKQYLLLTVKEYRKKFPDSKKMTLLE